MNAPDHALPAAPRGGGGAVRAFLARPRNRLVTLALLFTVCWIAAAAKMLDATGGTGLAVGVPLAAAPVPLVVGAFLMLARARPQPWPHLAFALSWGAGAGALAALYANSWSINAIVDRSGLYRGEQLGLTVVAPFVEEAAKGAAVLLLLLFRRHWFRGPLDGMVLAATTAAGFAFTENVLYFGRAFGEGSANDDAAAQTAAVFFARAVLTPFAHPLFTSATGIALGLAVLARNRVAAVLTGVGGYLTAVALHASWNGAAWKTTVDDNGGIMLLVYFFVMAPLLAGLFVYGGGLRRRQLGAVRAQLPWYVPAGWLTWNEPEVLGTVADRARQRRTALALYGKPGERALRRYQWNATALAELRERAVRGDMRPDFGTRERELLDALWADRAGLEPVLVNTLPTPRWGYGWAAPQPVAYPQPGVYWPGAYAQPQQAYAPYAPYAPAPQQAWAPAAPPAQMPLPMTGPMTGPFPGPWTLPRHPDTVWAPPQPAPGPWGAAANPPGWGPPAAAPYQAPHHH
ncbi:PrsW family intramembrane metalloprotease [Yinghuangia seranimata]|uniref:PrsW family intramembrane metalloprotease n=1 Tax=Yinghuangia seranimata TaxID=408067 RepID=UPI00248D2482|nr:PrsW family intramembrane metalloprotease [Yinghuangia seranimata]MDI2132662.1 PrsW family intramembrane metalloprotease [Yinghuangia seranimata]